MVFTALSYREMSRAFPVAGSVYAYAGRGINPSAGFLAGWAILLDYLLVPTLCYVAGAAALHAVLPQIPQSLWVVRSCVQHRGQHARHRDDRPGEQAVSLGELIVLAAFVALGVAAVMHGVNGAHWSLTPFFSPRSFQVSIMFSALSVAVLSFLGFDAISTLAEEAKGGIKVSAARQ